MQAPDSTQKGKLVDQALALVQADLAQPSDLTRQSIQRFREQSSAHAQAIAHAERFHQMANRIKRPQPSLIRRISYQADLFMVKATETRGLLATTVLAVAATLWFWLGANDNVPAQLANADNNIQTQQLMTRGASHKEVELEDGSIIWLGWRTTAQVEFSTHARIVRLREGMAAFKVAADANRPFTVISDAIQTEVTGTEFVVDRRQKGRVEVAVLEGNVAVKGADERVSKLAAAQAVIAESGQLGPIMPRSVEEIGRWREGMLVFKNRPIIDALTHLAPYTPYQLDTQMLQDHRGTVSGMFFTEQAEDGLFSILATHRIAFTQANNTLRLRPEHELPPRPAY
ncbi:MAG: FecR domain-containing protein [Pseudomonadota bacterium]